MPQGKLPPRATWVVVGHEVQPLTVMGDIREPDIQECLHIQITNTAPLREQGPSLRDCVGPVPMFYLCRACSELAAAARHVSAESLINMLSWK